MCAKCVAIDKKIERFRWIAGRMSDRTTLRAIEDLIEQHQAEKRALHPEEGELPNA